MEFEHFLFGKLSLREMDNETGSKFKCFGCQDLIYGLAYIDESDYFPMHKSCAELHRQIQNIDFHPHPLSFHLMGVIVCDGCGTLRAGLTYRCMSCMFNLDFKCAMAVFNGDHQLADLHKGKLIKTTIHHFSHNHQLTRCKCLVPTTVYAKEPFTDFFWMLSYRCMACKQNLHGTIIYTCLPCKFALHESCVNEMPRQVLQSPFHPQHVLLPRQISKGPSQIRCEACRKKVHGISFRCNQCDRDLHVSCAKYRTRAIKHSCHPDHHLLLLGKGINIPRIFCHYCGKDFGDISFFSCKKCNFHVHLECVPELPRVTQTRHHLHPLVLTTCLVEDDSGEYYCDICEVERNSEHHVYYCNECNYIAHVDCVLFEGDPTVQMFLDRQQMAENVDEPTTADQMSDRMLEYGEGMVNSEKNIQKEAFHNHPLTFYDDPEALFVCDGCGELCLGSSYRCSQCEFILDLKCVALNDELAKHKAEQGREIKTTVYHFCHSHPLTRCKIDSNLPTGIHDSCMACKKDLICGLMYTCLQCEFMVHESCLNNMLMQVQSPLHPQHLLQPYQLNLNTYPPECDACAEEVKGIMYVCSEFDCKLHSSCASYRTREIKHSCHPHHLLHFGKSIFVKRSPKCHACGEDCNNTLFCCNDCEFKIHLECIPLPYIVKHKRHQHRLTLTKAVIEDDSGEYYCDICETERNPELDVYYCKECTFIAHIDCVISKVEPPEQIHEYLVRRLRRLTRIKRGWG